MSAHFGAMCSGTDIDGRQMRGKGSDLGIASNLQQYGLAAQWLSSTVMDIKHNAWSRNRVLFDAITCDPPYGVRAGAKVRPLLRGIEFGR